MGLGLRGSEILIIAAILALPIGVTFLVFTRRGQSTTNRLLSLLLIWLVPVIGPLAVLPMLFRTVEA